MEYNLYKQQDLYNIPKSARNTGRKSPIATLQRTNNKTKPPAFRRVASRKQSTRVFLLYLTWLVVVLKMLLDVRTTRAFERNRRVPNYASKSRSIAKRRDHCSSIKEKEEKEDEEEENKPAILTRSTNGLTLRIISPLMTVNPEKKKKKVSRSSSCYN